MGANSSKISENEDLVKKLNHATLQQMKRELEDSEDCRMTELDDCKRNLEKQHKAEYAKLSQEKANLADELCNERDSLITELAHYKRLQTAQMLNAEDNNQHASCSARVSYFERR